MEEKKKKNTKSQKVTKEQVLKAIEGSRGTVTNVSRLLHVSYKTAKKIIQSKQEYMEAMEDELEKMLDIAEMNIYEDITENKNIQTSKWFLGTKGRNRGYSSEPAVVDIANDMGGVMNIRLIGDEGPTIKKE